MKTVLKQNFISYQFKTYSHQLEILTEVGQWQITDRHTSGARPNLRSAVNKNQAQCLEATRKNSRDSIWNLSFFLSRASASVVGQIHTANIHDSLSLFFAICGKCEMICELNRADGKLWTSNLLVS